MDDLQNLLESKTMTLQQYLSMSDNDTYCIPFSQRQYEWGKNEINRLFNDFLAVFDGSEDVHSLDFFTLSRENEYLKIYDGQQRTVTCLLLLSIISQKLFIIGDKKGANQIQREYFVTEDNLDDDKESIKKIQFDDDLDSNFFYKITNLDYMNDELASDIKKLHKNSNKKSLLNGYKILLENVQNTFFKMNNYEDIKKNLHKFYNSIVKKSILVRLVAYNDNIATSMFDSLNNTGKDLEKYYVLKNTIVKAIGENKVRDSWRKIDKNLIDLSHNQFLISFTKLINADATGSNSLSCLYKKYNPKSSQDMEKLLNKLVYASNNFLKICQTNQLTIKSNKKETMIFRKLSKYLSVFKIRQHYPIILGMLLNKDKIEDINKVLWSVLVLGIRNFYFGDARSNTIAKDFATYAKKTYQKQISVDTLINDIKNSSYNDEKTSQNIINKYYSHQSEAKTLLVMLYNNLLENSETEIKVDKVDIEHILPKKPLKNSKWYDNFPDDSLRDKYTYSIGNLTLWVASKNRSMKNKDFSKKRESYKDSPIKENKFISENKDWSSKEIDNRSEKLSKEILNLLK